MPSPFRAGAIALISGGASGVGFAFARHCRSAGMHLALLDINGQSLSAARSSLEGITPLTASGAQPSINTYEIDVSDTGAWSAVHKDLVAKQVSHVDFLLLNAGTSFKFSTPAPWGDVSYFQKTLGVNFFGIINGLSTFLPLILASPGPASIVLTGSKQGITNPPGNPAYNASKAAVKSLAEQLAYDLRTATSSSYAPQVSAHLLVPGWTFTGLSGNVGPTPDDIALEKKPKGAWLGSQVAEYGVKKIEEGKFYIICPDDDVDEALDQARMVYGAGDLVEGRSALSRWDGAFKDQAAKWIGEEATRRRG